MHNKNIKFNKRRIPLIFGLVIGGAFLFSYLTFITTPTFAAESPNPAETRKLSDITYMQEMNAAICYNSDINDTKQLEDIRDGNKYWVTKLKDSTTDQNSGKCWMTQNLDYDIPDKNQQDISKWNGSTVTSSTSAYYDPDASFTGGQKYYYNGSDNKHGWNSTACMGNATGLSSCIAQGFATAVSTNDEKDHYLVGNYYSWPAATMTDGVDGQDTSSVCPTNWRLPTSGNNTGEFRELMLAYGWTTDNPSNIALNMNNSKGIFGDPLYFVYGGYLANGELNDAGYIGYYWSSAPNSDGTSAYNLFFNSSVSPFNYYGSRYYGVSVRCVANPLITTSENLSQPDVPPTSDQSNISITVSPVISLDVTKEANDMTVDFTQVSTSNIIANVSSNQQYTVSLSTDQSTLEQSEPVESQNIPMITTDKTITAGTNQWGIKKKLSATDNTKLGNTENATNYSPIGLNDNHIVFYKSAGPEALTTATGQPLTLEVGVSVSPQLPQGTYSTIVTLTAATV